MKAISLWQPYASLLVTRQPSIAGQVVGTIGQPRPMVKRFETRSWPCPPKLIGQRFAFHAAARRPDHLSEVGEWSVHSASYVDGGPQIRRLGAVVDGELVADRYERGLVIDLRLGAVVGSGIVTACYPIVERGSEALAMPCIDTDGHTLRLVQGPDPAHDLDISDQLPYGDYSTDGEPRFAWLIEDAAPTTERCPWCWGSGDEQGSEVDSGIPVAIACETCNGAGRCEPIPAKGKQRIWDWTPS